MEWNMNITHGLISFFGNNRGVAKRSEAAVKQWRRGSGCQAKQWWWRRGSGCQAKQWWRRRGSEAVVAGRSFVLQNKLYLICIISQVAD